MTIQMAIDVIPCSLLNVAAVIDVIDAISHNHSILSGWKKRKEKKNNSTVKTSNEKDGILEWDEKKTKINQELLLYESMAINKR